MTEPTDRELLWRQYKTHIDLYKSYLDLVIKFNVFYYAITGGILSYFFTNKAEPLMKWSLLLPFLMSLMFGGFFLFGASLAKVSREEVFSIRDALGFETAPELQVLVVLLRIFGSLCLIMAVALATLFFKTG